MYQLRSPHRKSPDKKTARRAFHRPLQLEALEPRLLLYHGPTIFPDGSVEVGMDETLDQFGFQIAMFQAYESLVTFSIFDTGASVVTVSATDQFLFDLFGSGGVPIKVRCGAQAEGVGGALTGHVSEPGTVMADGLHVGALKFDEFGFPEFDIQFDPAEAAIVSGVQAFVGALSTRDDPGGCPDPASSDLPTITGTPILNATTDHPNGTAAVIRPQGELLDFSDFPELNGLVLPVPDLQFQNPGLGIPDDPACTRNDVSPPRRICTDPVRIGLDFVGFDNHTDPGDVPTESFNPVQNHVQVAHGAVVRSDQVFLLDTGAQLSILSTDLAVALGLDLDNPETSISVQGAGGSVADIPGYTIDRLQVPLDGGGTLSFVHVPIYVLDVAPGVLDGILGMNLFNNAAAMVYDPFDPAGPSLELNFFTEHAVGDDDLGGGALGILQSLMPAFAATVSGGHLPGFQPRDSAAPRVSLSAPVATNDATPVVSVTATDRGGLSDGTGVAIDVDLTGDGDFDDAGERDYVTATLSDGAVRVEITPALAEGVHQLRARVADVAGNEGASDAETILVDLTPPSLASVPGDQSFETLKPLGTAVNFAPPTASDNLDTAPAVVCSPPSGSVFPLGTTAVRCTATDDAGNSASATFQITVAAPPGSFNLTAGVLTIIGTDQNDTIQLVKAGRGLRVQANFGTFTVPNRTSLTRVVVRAAAGNDRVNLALLTATQNAFVDGGAGDDVITGGAGHDVLLGHGGNDQLNGGQGDNLLIGGLGSDRLVGSRGRDVLLAGAPDAAAIQLDLAAILAASRLGRTPAAQRAVLQTLLDHVLDDGAADLLTGGPGIDLFQTGVTDQITDRKREDLIA